MSVVQYLSGDLTRSERKRKSRGADPPPYPIVGCCGYQATPNGHSCVSRRRRLGKVWTNDTAAKIVMRLSEIDEDRRMLCCGSSGTVNAFLAAWCICRHGCAPTPFPLRLFPLGLQVFFGPCKSGQHPIWRVDFQCGAQLRHIPEMGGEHAI